MLMSQRETPNRGRVAAGFLRTADGSAATRSWTEFHHVEQLTEEHARKLLRRGRDVFVQDRKGVTLEDRAEKVLSAKKRSGAAAAKLSSRRRSRGRQRRTIFPVRADAVKALLLVRHEAFDALPTH